MSFVYSKSLEHTANRRISLRHTAFLLGLAGLAGTVVWPERLRAAVAKLAQRDIGYQSNPKGSARCELCVNWQAPNACKLVTGPISPSGWCGLYARKT